MPIELVPEGLSASFAGLLIFASFFTSALTAAMGLGGGVLMLAIMAYGLPVAALIPVHGAVQLGSNAGRLFVQRSHVAWRAVAFFALGGVFGGLVGAQFVIALPEAILSVILGCFILMVTWVKLPAVTSLPARVFVAVGAITTFASMFVGATGPLNAAFFSRALASRQQLVATLAATMSAQHTIKVAGFALAGVAFGNWTFLILAMIATGFAGTMTGTLLLSRLPERTFRVVLKALLTVLGLDLMRRGFFA